MGEQGDNIAVQLAVLTSEMRHIVESIDELKESTASLAKRVAEQDELIQRGKGVLMLLGLIGSAILALPTLISGYFKAKS